MHSPDDTHAYPYNVETTYGFLYRPLEAKQGMWDIAKIFPPVVLGLLLVAFLLTAMVMEGSPAFRHATICAQAARNTHSVRGLIMPILSAVLMNSSGGTWPSCGCCQRDSASTPIILPVATSTWG